MRRNGILQGKCRLCNAVEQPPLLSAVDIFDRMFTFIRVKLVNQEKLQADGIDQAKSRGNIASGPVP